MHQYDETIRILDSGYTCVIKDGDEIVFTSTYRGVKPIIDFINQGKIYTNLTIIDKIIGRGAMFLAVKSEAKNVYTPIISERALEVAKLYNIDVHYKKVIPYIINRTKDGCCPIENAVTGITDSEEAYATILKTLEQLRNK